MSEHIHLIDTLKAVFKERKMTYKEIGGALGISESSIKRMFASDDMSLERMQALLDLAGLDFGGLLARSEQAYRTIDSIDIAVEQELVDDELLLLIWFHLANGWTVDQLIASLKAPENEIRQYVYRLAKLGVLEVLVGDRVRMLLSRNFQWQPDGPLRNFLRNQVMPEFADSDFTGAGELQLMSNAWLSESSLKEVHNKAYQLVERHKGHAENDRSLPLHNRNATTLLISIRPWSLSIFDKYFKVDTAPDINADYWQ